LIFGGPSVSTPRQAGTAAHLQNKYIADKNGTTPHPPAVLDQVNFSVLFFYKSDRQGVPVLAAYARSPTEKIEKNFSVFQF